MQFHLALLILLSLIAATATEAKEPSKPVLISARLIRPDQEVERLIGLFRGSRASDPAQALAAWKRASQDPKRLGKPAEAILAAMNPRMARELQSLDEARLTVRPWADSPAPSWSALLPHDDGSFAALASAFVLTDGREDLPFEGISIDRLGPPGSVFMARGASGLTLAGTRNDLVLALSDPGLARPLPPDTPASCLKIAVNPNAIDDRNLIRLPLPVRALMATGARSIESDSGLEGTAFHANFVQNFEGPANSEPLQIDPNWLNMVPKDRTVAAFSSAMNPTVWDKLLAIADRFEKQDPSRAGLAPARLRLNLIARAFGVRLEADFLPHLRGATAWVGSNGAGTMDHGLLTLHFDNVAVAERVVRAIRPSDQLVLEQRGSDLLVGWGKLALQASLAARDDATRSAGTILRSAWTGAPPARVGGVWPGRIRDIAPKGTPLAIALEESSPIVGSGRNLGTSFQDVVVWRDLDRAIRRFLELIPLDPPPDSS